MKSARFSVVTATIIFFAAQLNVAEAGSFKPENIMAHISILAHDSLEGRRVGDPGARKASAYIRSQFEDFGLEPGADDGTFRQEFEFTADTRIGEKSSMVIAGRELQLGGKSLGDFQPLYSSKVGEFSYDSLVYVGYGIEFDSLDHHDYADRDVRGKAVLISRNSPDGDDPHGPYYAQTSLGSKIAEAIKHEVAGIFFFTPEDIPEAFEQRWRSNESQRDIPIVFLSRSVFTDSIPTPEELAAKPISGLIDLVRVRKTGANTLGLLTGGKEGAADKIIVIGAHYDHLGYGGKGTGSLYAGSDPQIHNGADDNASGTAGVIELARYFSDRKAELDFSIMFVAFSGEESGLLGSNYFVKHPPLDLEKVSFMINMDMIGRFRPESKGLGIFGVGTSPTFKEWFDGYDGDIKVNTSESGVGPSDHTAFYNSGLPVLHCFTGTHQDYHKPSDDVELIDADAEADVLSFIASLIEGFAGEADKLEFSKTKDQAPGGPRRFSVTMGIMPDYLTEVKGLRIDGVTEDKAANLAGLIAGDIIVQLGDYAIDDIYGYMTALGKFRKGDTTTVVVTRNGEKLELPIVF
ncbi:MAG: M28 family peptidase [Candidatus Zixiibacteriota bacterium]